MSRARWLCASVFALTVGHLVGCSRPYIYTAPATFTVTNESVSKTIEAVMTYTSTVPIDGTPVVSCTGETHCTMAYTIQYSVGESPNWADQEMIRPTRQIWKTLFTDPQFQSGTITVSGPAPSAGGKRQPYYSLTCDRQHTVHIDWTGIQGSGIRHACDYSPVTQGMPGT